MQPDELVTIEKLLHGLLLRSGNDAAYALAEYVGGSVEGFVKLMNDRLEQLGIGNAHLMNPSGLDDKGHYASANAVAQMLRIALLNKQFAQIASTVQYEQWQNKHRLVVRDQQRKEEKPTFFTRIIRSWKAASEQEQPRAVAGKTGYTKIAGRTLATSFQGKGMSFIIVTLNESNDSWINYL